MEQTWTLGREHWERALVSSGKKASTTGRLREVGSARKSVAESVAFAMTNSGVAMAEFVEGSSLEKIKRRKSLCISKNKVVMLLKLWWS